MPTPQDPVPVARPDSAALVRGRLMQQSLRSLLDCVRGSREVLPHLAALEVSLGRGGSAVIDDIPVHWLARICSQLSSLPLPQDDPPLHNLLSRLMDRLEAQCPAMDLRSSFGGQSGLEVNEASHSDFVAVVAEQATTMPSDLD